MNMLPPKMIRRPPRILLLKRVQIHYNEPNVNQIREAFADERMKHNMPKIMTLLVLAVSLASAAQADTLYLKNGSVLKGTFIGFENGQFIMEVTAGNQTKFATARVLRLEIERDSVGRRSRGEDRPWRDSGGISSPAGAQWEATAPFDVRLEDQWARSQVQISKGQRVRVEASGNVLLDNRVSVTPAGLSGRRDPNALMPNENDGALIAVIGEDYDAPPILIGSSREFVADRDGMLYFTVNHMGTGNTQGAFRVNVSVNRRPGQTTGAAAGQTPGRERNLLVSGAQAWTDTGIDVEPNSTVDITAEGQITIGANIRTGPDGSQTAKASTSTYPIQRAGLGAVIAKIRFTNGRESNLLLIGSRSQISTRSNESGRLFIGVNDDYFNDNSGTYRVTIRW